MKLLFYILVLFGMLPAFGQTYPDIRVDTSMHTTEFFVDDYEMNSGLGSVYWKLENNHKLRFGQATDRPPNPASKLIGMWALSLDTLIFTIEKRTNQDATINPVKERPNVIKFNTAIFTWTTYTDGKTKNNDSLTLTSFCTVLINPEVDVNKLLDELSIIVKDKMKDDHNYDEPNLFVRREGINRVNQIIKEFLYERKYFVATKTFSNGALIDP